MCQELNFTEIISHILIPIQHCVCVNQLMSTTWKNKSLKGSTFYTILAKRLHLRDTHWSSYIVPPRLNKLEYATDNWRQTQTPWLGWSFFTQYNQFLQITKLFLSLNGQRCCHLSWMHNKTVKFINPGMTCKRKTKE